MAIPTGEVRYIKARAVFAWKLGGSRLLGLGSQGLRVQGFGV